MYKEGDILECRERRADNIDILKAICAFLIVCIHIPFPGKMGEYFTALTRTAVPIFFMITGYFYLETMKKHRESQQLKKIFRLLIEANVLYFFWKLVLDLVQGESAITYIQVVFSAKNLVKFLILNDSPVGGHLWYLGAILYVLVLVLIVDKLKCREVLFYLTPILLITDLALGKYALLIFHREFPYILVRNFLCVGIPYFCIGNLIREKKDDKMLSKDVVKLLIIIFALTSMGERIALVRGGFSAARDHYISTTPLAVCLFVYALKSDWNNKILAIIGRKYSTWIYIIHPIFITMFSFITDKLGIQVIYKCVAPIVIYCVTLIFLIIIQMIKTILREE